MTQRINLSFIPFNLVPFVRLYTSASDCTGFENIPGSHFVEAFSARPSHSLWCQ